ncbi:MAG: acyl carrier protein [Clostridiales bacterium]|nr:acyl carrier protein [Clostridiales bacterium]
MENEIKEKIRSFIIRVTRKQEITDDEDIFQGGIVNSLLTLQLILFIEKNFDISVENEEMDIENFKTINRIEEFISKKKNS